MTSAIATDDDRRWMDIAIDLSRKCEPVPRAYSVGSVVVGADGQEIARGWSRDSDPHVHAEESALSKVPPDDAKLAGATIYSTLEPCSVRRSRPRTCTQLILATAIPRIVIAWREPSLLVADCQGFEDLVAAGRTVIELHEMADQAREVNAHLWSDSE